MHASLILSKLEELPVELCGQKVLQSETEQTVLGMFDCEDVIAEVHSDILTFYSGLINFSFSFPLVPCVTDKTQCWLSDLT